MLRLATLIYILFTKLTKKEKIIAFQAIFFSFISGVFDIVGISLIFSYVSLIVEPAKIEEIELVRYLKEAIRPYSSINFLALMGFLLVFFYFIRALAAFICSGFLAKFALFWLGRTSEALFYAFMNKDYAYYLDNGTTEARRYINEIVPRLTYHFIQPLMYLVSETLTFLIILGFLFYLRIELSIILLFLCSVVLGTYLAVSHGYLRKLIVQRTQGSQSRAKSVNESFNIIKEVYIFPGSAEYFAKQQKSANAMYMESQMKGNFIYVLPRIIIEFLSTFALLTIIIFELVVHSSKDSSIALVALYGMAALRILPSFLRILQSLNQVRTESSDFLKMYSQFIDLNKIIPKKQERPTGGQDFFEQSLALKGISFKYKSSVDEVLNNINITIKKNSFVAIVGQSGVGKSTLMDVMMGILPPSKGNLLLDNKKISYENYKKIIHYVGYVPQRFNLLDKTLAENIAFPAERENIDMDLVRDVCKKASISKFIESSLENGYDTIVGERAGRLSGGQAQRIALARALYRKPQILILDEPTSALDGISENEVNETIAALKGKMSIVLVAHKSKLFSLADTIFLMDDGRIVDHGTYQTLSKKWPKLF